MAFNYKCAAVAKLKPYYYLVYALRRLSKVPEGKSGFREWRATLILLLVEVRLLFAILDCAFPSLFDAGTPLGWGVLLGIPVALVTHVVLENRQRYARFVVLFQSWSKEKRLAADIGVALFVVFALVSPVIARSVMTGIPWWK